MDIYDAEIDWIMAQTSRPNLCWDLWCSNQCSDGVRRAGVRLFDHLSPTRGVESSKYGKDYCGCPSQVYVTPGRHSTGIQALDLFVCNLVPRIPHLDLTDDAVGDRIKLEKFAACQREADKLVEGRSEMLQKLGSPKIGVLANA